MDHFLLIDDAQQTYWDDALWTWLKDYCQAGLRSFRVALFCGHEYNTDGKCPTPPHISPESKIQLDREPRTTGGQPIGLKLSEKEFEEVYIKHDKTLRCDMPLRQLIYNWTDGHVGAVKAMFGYITRKVSMIVAHRHSSATERARVSIARLDEYRVHSGTIPNRQLQWEGVLLPCA